MGSTAEFDPLHFLSRQAIKFELPAIVNAPLDREDLKSHPLVRFEKTRLPTTDIPFPNILLIDDDWETAYVASMILQRRGLDVFSISGDNAPVLAFAYLGSLEESERAKIALIICDFAMPDIHGVALLTILKKNLLKNTPAAIITNTPLGVFRQRTMEDPMIVEQMADLGIEAWSKIDFAAHPVGTLRAIQQVRLGIPRGEIRIHTLD